MTEQAIKGKEGSSLIIPPEKKKVKRLKAKNTEEERTFLSGRTPL